MDLNTLTYYFTQYGAIAIFIIVFLEYLNLPGFPAGVIMPLSGIMASKGNIHFIWVMVITVFAGLLGSMVLYLLSWAGGTAFLKAYTRRFPKQSEGMEKNLKWVREKGCIGIFFAKLIPVLRTLVPIPAGILRIHPVKYIISSTLGIFVFNFVFVGAGYIMGDQVFAFLETL